MPTAFPPTDEPRVAVITGGHSYDVVGFNAFVRSLEADVYLQHIDDFCSSSAETRRGYDVVLFYMMLAGVEGVPVDEGLPWYAGKPRTALGELGQSKQGIFVLHHAILNYPKWPTWFEIGGVVHGHFAYHHDERVKVHVADAEHPITRGMGDFEWIDETYDMPEPAAAGSRVLLTTDHPASMKTLGWVRQYRQSRVFCLQSGHDQATFGSEPFRAIVNRGIQWCAGRI